MWADKDELKGGWNKAALRTGSLARELKRGWKRQLTPVDQLSGLFSILI